MTNAKLLLAEAESLMVPVALITVPPFVMIKLLLLPLVPTVTVTLTHVELVPSTRAVLLLDPASASTKPFAF